jgi:SNF2 family DNA or RNA helicase
MTYLSKRKPRVKQAEALAAIRNSPDRHAFGLRMAMRTGKTKVVADDFGELHDAGLVDDLLIIAPAGLYKTWWRPETNDGLVADWPDDLIERASVHIWKSGSYGSTKAKRELEQFLNHKSGPRVLIMNIEAISAVKAAQDLVLKFVKGKRRVYCAIDESTIIKKPGTERTKFCLGKLKLLCDYRRILSGLIAPRSPLDLWAQFAFLDLNILGHNSFRTFQSRYAVTRKMEAGGRRFDMVVGFQNVDELYGKIAPWSFRCRLEDCYDLPATEYVFLDVELTKEQKEVYRNLKEYATAELAANTHVTATSVITQMIRLHQVLCGHTADEDGNVHIIKENRTQALLDYLEHYDGKAIIWASYDLDVQKIATALTKEYGEGSVARFWGGNRSTRDQEELRFKTDPACRFIVATPAAGGRGRTWDVADLNIYYSCLNDLEQRAQSEERGRAVGKTKPMLNVDMRAPGTIEERFVKALRDKIDISTVINGDNYMEWLI